MSKKNESPKQHYQPPKLKDFGPVEQLTQGTTAFIPDGLAGSKTV